MLIRPKARNVNPQTPMQFWLLVGTSCVAMTGLLGTLSTRAVRADAVVPRPAATAGPDVAKATPNLAATSANPSQVESKHRKLLRGIASWYGSVFNGRKTASGETFDMYAMTACHPTLPFGTLVRVVNLRNKRSVVVRITDRGDLGDEGRVIDLSYGAAEKLQMTHRGLARVSLEILSPMPFGQKNN
jgi:rare lipoprotein A